MLAQYMLYGPCLSVTSRCSAKTSEWIELICGMEASFDLGPYHTLCCKEIWSTLKIRLLSSGTLSLTRSGLRKFRQGSSIVGAVNEDDDGQLYLSHLRHTPLLGCRPSMRYTHFVYSLQGYGTSPLIVKRTSRIPSVALELSS